MKSTAIMMLAAASAFASPAAAAEWELNFAGQYWAYDNHAGYRLTKIKAILTTDDVQSRTWSYEGYRIRGMRGTRDGVAITGIREDDGAGFDGPLGWPNYPFLNYDAGSFYYFGAFGFAFQTADGNWYNLNSFGDTDGNDASERQIDPADPTGLFIVQIGTISVTRLDTPAVPEPASWAMMILGTGVIGGSLRARARRVRVAFA